MTEDKGLGINFNAPVTVGTFVKVESGATYIKNNFPGVTHFEEAKEDDKESQPLTEDDLKEKIARVRQRISTNRLWFPVCKYMMWRKMVAEGDFATAVNILQRLYPDLRLNADDLSSLNVLSFRKQIDDWDPADAPVHGTTYNKY